MKQTTRLLLVAAVFLLAVPAGDASAASYKDLNGHFAQTAVESLAESGLLTSGTDGLFEPNRLIDNATYVRWMTGVFGAAAAQKTFSTKDGVRRAEAALQLADLLARNYPRGEKRDGTIFKDLNGATQAERDAIGELHHYGVLLGGGDGSFRPNDRLTRGEAAILLDRAVARQLLAGHSTTFAKLSLADAAGAAKELVESKGREQGVFTAKDGTGQYVLVSLGMKPTNGYGVAVTDVIETPGALFVQTKVTLPDPGAPQAEVLTYPSALVKIPATEKPVYLLPAKLDMGRGLQIEKGAEVLMTRVGQLDNDAPVETVAVIGCQPRKIPGGVEYLNAYVGIFKGKERVQLLDLHSETPPRPSELILQDISGDGRKDILVDLEIGGSGAIHQAAAFVQGKDGLFGEAPVDIVPWAEQFRVKADNAAKTVELTSPEGRTWTFRYAGSELDFGAAPLAELDVPGAHEVTVADGVLHTRHAMSSGHRLNHFGELDVAYKYEQGRMKAAGYEIRLPDGSEWTLDN